MASTHRSTRHPPPSSPPVIPRNLPDPPLPPSGPRPEAPSTPSAARTKNHVQQPLSPIAPLRTPSSRPKQPCLPPVAEGDSRLLRDLHDPPPGDPLRRRGSSPGLSKQRGQYYGRTFAREEDARRQGRVIVIAELKTNVFVQDEMAFLTALSDHLSTRYATPMDGIAVHLVHGTCLLLGGTFDPAYVVSIYTLPHLVQTATNKRNAALLQKMMKDMLEVSVDRGVVRYVPVAEHCFARAGKTLAGGATVEDDEDEGDGQEDKPARRTTVGRFGRFKAKSPPPMPPLPAKKHSQEESRRATTGTTAEKEQLPDTGPLKERSLRHKRSFNFVQSIFRMSSRKGGSTRDGQA